ncbi:glycosyltransferase family protein [Hwanghaeella grinnelliae]|nr:glycosyltransferase [Hwanghaeella grinnelliae]
MSRGHHKRVLMYSHDTFGLGHLRRVRAIAHALVEESKDVSVLILTGSSIIGSFDFRTRVDFVRVPGVIKLRNGEYTPLKLHMNIADTLAIRESIIRHTAETFDPDLFIVDKEPLGLHGEVESTLQDLNEKGIPCVLGLRDVMDEPALLEPEWKRKRAIPALSQYYDELWVYGLPQFCDPLEGLEIPQSVRRKMVYTGYLQRSEPADLPTSAFATSKINKPYIMVTPGGGGDGEELVDWVLQAYETDRKLPYPALVVLGPFMSTESQAAFKGRAEKLDDVEIITFDAHLEQLIVDAVGMVAMGGYNTFCEILSFDKPAVIVPRRYPRREQYIRAKRAQELGLLNMLDPEETKLPKDMATALRHLPQQNPPSEVIIPGLLDGLESVNILAARLAARPRNKVRVASSK